MATRVATSYSAGTERNTMVVDIDEKTEELRVLRQQVQRTLDWLERCIAALTRVKGAG
jgi:ribosomal protein S1